MEYILSHRAYKLVKPGTLTVSIYPNFYPVAYRDAAGRFAGCDVDMIALFAKAAELKLEFIERPWDGIWTDPVKGISDVSIGGIGITPKRTLKNTAWTIPYFRVQRTYIYNKNFELETGLDSARVRATKGSTGWLDMTDMGLKLEEGKSDAEDIQDLLDGKIDALMRGSFVGRAISKRYPDLVMGPVWDIAPHLVGPDGEVFAFPTECHSGLAQALSAGIGHMLATGQLDDILRTHDLID